MRQKNQQSGKKTKVRFEWRRKQRSTGQITGSRSNGHVRTDWGERWRDTSLFVQGQINVGRAGFQVQSQDYELGGGAIRII